MSALGYVFDRYGQQQAAELHVNSFIGGEFGRRFKWLDRAAMMIVGGSLAASQTARGGNQSIVRCSRLLRSCMLCSAPVCVGWLCMYIYARLRELGLTIGNTTLKGSSNAAGLAAAVFCSYAAHVLLRNDFPQMSLAFGPFDLLTHPDKRITCT